MESAKTSKRFRYSSAAKLGFDMRKDQTKTPTHRHMKAHKTFSV